MKASLCIAVSLLCLYVSAGAAPKYWVGATNGNWSDRSNWSDTYNGAGGTSLPDASDSVIFRNSDFPFDTYRSVHVDVSPTVTAMLVQENITLYASSQVRLVVTGSLNIHFLSLLKDSTSADVAFNFIFRGSSHASAYIFGTWVFEGGTPINRALGNGAAIIAEAGSNVNIISRANEVPIAVNSGRIIFKNNTGFISSSPSSMRFFAGTKYILDNNQDASIPNATWATDSANDYATVLARSMISIVGSMGVLTHLATSPQYSDLSIDLPGQSKDVSLLLPDNTWIHGNLSIINSNNKTVSLLAPTASGSSVSVLIELHNERNHPIGGTLLVNANTKVALATAIAAAPSNSYHLQIATFEQRGGNFSLQDYNESSGSSTLSVTGNVLQTGGSFITNSSSTSPLAKFVLEMNGPVYTYLPCPCDPNTAGQAIQMGSGTIDNGRHMVTLKLSQTLRSPSIPATGGVTLLSPLEVGRLELENGPVNSTAINLLTVTNPGAASGIKVGTAGNSYVNGPLRRWTNSTDPYLFPTGKGNLVLSPHYDSCVLIPATAELSLYQAEYFNIGFADLIITSPLKGISGSEYWNISRIVGAEASVKISLNGAIPGSTATDAIVSALFTNGGWVAENGSVLLPGNSATGSVTSKPLSVLGAFTFAYTNAADLGQGSAIGLAYKYYEGFFNVLPDFNSLTPVKTGYSPNVDIGVKRSGVNDSFAIIWQGNINIPAPGNYTFETVSDDGSRLYFNSLYSANSTPLVDNDGTHPSQSAYGNINVPAAGSYPIAITYFENYGGQGMQVYWSGPGIARQLIPDGAFSAGASLDTSFGLNYKYYKGDFGSLPEFSTLAPSKTGKTANININDRPAGVNDQFAFVWEGFITIPRSGDYTFETMSDDGSKLYFNAFYTPGSQALVNNDGLHANWLAAGTVSINAGEYPVSITYFEKDGGENMQVYWTGPGIERQLIPATAFHTFRAPLSSGLNYKYYEGNFNTLPDFNSLTPVKSGRTANVDIGIRPAGTNDHFAMVWQGYINIPRAGSYNFETVSDDGSKIYFNSAYTPGGRALVNNDSVHAPWSATGTVSIANAGIYPILITYFEKDGGEGIQVYWTGPGIERQLIPDNAFSANDDENVITNVTGITKPALTPVEKAIEITRLYPNPFSEGFHIEFYNSSANNKVEVGIYDLKGNLLLSLPQRKFVKGNSIISINLADKKLTEGIYFAKLTINGLPSKTIKLVKTKN